MHRCIDRSRPCHGWGAQRVERVIDASQQDKSNSEGLTGLGPHSYRDAHCESGFRSTRVSITPCQRPRSVCQAYAADKRELIPITGPHFSTAPCRYGPSSALPSMPSGNSGTCDPSCIIQECGQLSRNPQRPLLAVFTCGKATTRLPIPVPSTRTQR